ncbi:MAG TPA: ABC transporter substrate-binding protein [Stellaceae bacterium]|jgi:branched-chain amino acid transport system substrate-binding protein|nr:ABC transporter substrate-binding protein [Stellaceae bacterium]
MTARPLHSILLAALLLVAPVGARAEELAIPILVPLTGFLSLEGQSQRNGALLAFQEGPGGGAIRHDVADTGVSPEIAVNQLEKALEAKPVAVVASMLGTQMLAMLPIAAESKVPLVTVSGTAKITELGNPWVFRFFPGDNVVKVVHARYVVEALGKKRPAIIYQSNAYGQSGLQYLTKAFAALGVTPVLSEGVDVSIKDLLPVLSKAKAAGADVIVSHLHAPSTALLIKQAAASDIGLPIVSGSAAATPSTAALLDPVELQGVCAESASVPVAPDSPEGERFVADYRKAYAIDPDAYALAQYDGVQMMLRAIAAGARTPDPLRAALAGDSYKGVAMTYKSDGAGNMAHSAIIVCYDGSGRIPVIVKRYDNIAALQ